MATVVNVPGDNRFGDIGDAFGEGLIAGFNRKEEQKAAERRNRRLNALINQAKAAGNKQDALALAGSPEFSDLFENFEQVQEFGQIVDQMFASPEGEDTEFVPVTVGGQQRNIALTPQRRKAMESAESPEQWLRETTGSEDAVFGSVDPGEQVELVDLLTGQTKGFVDESEMQSEGFQMPENVGTAEAFDRMLNLRKERRAAADTGSEGKEAVEVRAARGVLSRRGINEPSPEQLNEGIAAIRRADKFSDRLASVYRVNITEAGIEEQIEGSGEADRYTAAQIAIEDLMFDGLRGSQAFRAAKRIGDSLSVERTGFGGEPEVIPPKSVIETTPLNSSEFEEKIQEIKASPGAKTGEVIKLSDTEYLVFTGKFDEDGEPLLAEVYL